MSQIYYNLVPISVPIRNYSKIRLCPALKTIDDYGLNPALHNFWSTGLITKLFLRYRITSLPLVPFPNISPALSETQKALKILEDETSNPHKLIKIKLVTDPLLEDSAPEILSLNLLNRGAVFNLNLLQFLFDGHPWEVTSNSYYIAEIINDGYGVLEGNDAAHVFGFFQETASYSPKFISEIDYNTTVHFADKTTKLLCPKDPTRVFLRIYNEGPTDKTVRSLEDATLLIKEGQPIGDSSDGAIEIFPKQEYRYHYSVTEAPYTPAIYYRAKTENPEITLRIKLTIGRPLRI